MAKTLIVSSRVKELCKTEDGRNMNMDSTLPDALTYKVERILEKACKRAKQNGRNTVMSKDL